jgi:hypothetical protein
MAAGSAERLNLSVQFGVVMHELFRSSAGGCGSAQHENFPIQGGCIIARGRGAQQRRRQAR